MSRSVDHLVISSSLRVTRLVLTCSVPKDLPIPARWAEKVRFAGTDECWEWTASRDGDGYGRFQMPTANGQVHIRAHRWAYRHFRGPIPAGQVVMHLCDNPPCVNPSHLRLGTPLDNNADKVAKGRHAVLWGTPLARSRQTHCKRGHEFTEANTRVMPLGHRRCKECEKIKAREFYYRQRGLPCPPIGGDGGARST